MASRLSLLPGNILRKNYARYTQCILPWMDRSSPVRYFSTDEQKSGSSEETVKKFLACTLFISGFGYILYQWKDDFRRQLKSFRALWQEVHALSPRELFVSQNREKYNFIADVVEVTAQCVVNIEVAFTHTTHFIKGKPVLLTNGSGFIIHQDGLILTNAHVVPNKLHGRVQVRLHDGTTVPGFVEEIDVHSDLATVRINKTNLPVMKLGTSSNLRPGEFVIAIGSPLSLNNTITSGIVSSANRQSKEIGLTMKEMDYIQTDAAITYGNSGGPLVNLNGEAIGINVMKVTEGISFAIPIDHAKEFLKKAESRRKSKGTTATSHKRYIGISMLTLTSDILSQLHQNREILDSLQHGVFVHSMNIEAPAYKGGLRNGDIITHINGEPVTSSADIYVALDKPGDLYCTIVRKTQVLQLRISPEDL